MQALNKEKISEAPSSPGVYQFVDNRGDILYVGKAKNLKNRIKSYFRSEIGRGPWIEKMVAEATKIRLYETESEIEAVILEAELIKKIRPKYNLDLKDDKSFLLIKISKEDLPCVGAVRFKDFEAKKEKNTEYFGPYPAGLLLKKSLRHLRKVFPFRDCSKAKFATYHKKGRPCIYGDIRVCTAPCVGWINEREYCKNISYLKSFLKGKKKKVEKDLVLKMNALSKAKHFEQAGEFRDKLNALYHLREVALGLTDERFESAKIIFNRIECYDISNIMGNFAVGGMTVMTDGKINKDEYRKFKIKTVEGANDVLSISEIVKRRLNNSWSLPELILVDGGVAQLNAAEREIKKKKLSIPVIGIAKGPKRDKNEFVFSDQNVAKYFFKSPGLKKMLIVLRDEAHRFSISYYRSLHRKEMFK